MKYSRYAVGDRVELVNTHLVQLCGNTVVSGVNADVYNKRLIDVLKGTGDLKDVEWNAVEIDYVQVEVMEVKGMSSNTPVVRGVVVYVNKNIEGNIDVGDELYIHEGLKEFLNDKVMGRYVWSNYMPDPSKGEMDECIYCLTDYYYVDKTLSASTMRRLAKGRLAKDLITDAMNVERALANLKHRNGAEIIDYRKHLDAKFKVSSNPARIIMFNSLTNDYVDSTAHDKFVNALRSRLNTPVGTVCRVTIDDETMNFYEDPIVTYRFIIIMSNADYMLLSGTNPKQNEVFTILDDELKKHGLLLNDKDSSIINSTALMMLPDNSKSQECVATAMGFLFKE